uniref:Core Histone H2A/H2B/H3 domain-containing protein n=1 Tax=Oryza glumipatula TaxID=40148 RepID=A0A0D9YAX6_9ORYZ
MRVKIRPGTQEFYKNFTCNSSTIVGTRNMKICGLQTRFHLHHRACIEPKAGSTYTHVYYSEQQREGMEQTLDIPRSLRLPTPKAQQQMDEFWRDRQKEIETTKDFSEHAIPMARLKKIVSSQKGNMMMTFDMPAFLSKMCELFVQELAVRAWASAQSHNRCIILDTDIAKAIASTESYDFLVDILRNHRVKHKSSPCSTLTTKRCRLVDQPSTSHMPYQHQLPQFAPTYTLAIPITPSLMPPISHYIPFQYPSLSQEVSPMMASAPIVNRSMLLIHNIARGLGLQGNNISTFANNNIPDNIIGCSSPAVLASMMSPALLEVAGTSLNPPNSHSICMMNMINSSDPSGSSIGDINVANQASLAPSGHFNPAILRESSCPSFLHSNNNDTIVAIPEGVDISGTMDVANDVAAIVINGQEEHERETNVEHHQQNEIYESIDIGIINASVADGNKCSISWDELGMADDSLLDKFLEEFQVRNDSVLRSGIELHEDPFLGNVMLENPSTSNANK